MHLAPPSSDPKEAEAARKATSIGLNVLSKVFAILVLSVLPVLAGYYVDRWLHWQCFIFVGSLLSVLIAMSGLLSIANQANLELRNSTKKG